MVKISCVVGTRPEAIKMAPVIKLLQTAPWASANVVATGQHRELAKDTLECFSVSIDTNFDVMTKNQSLSSLTAKMIDHFDQYISTQRPDMILAQGDTTTVFAASLVCFYRGIPMGHVEAGLRTLDIHNPFPEEFNRRVTGIISTLNFAPTKTARDNLMREGVPASAIHVTGNTVIDALLEIRSRKPLLPFEIDQKRTLILLTAHRRENFGPPLQNIFGAVRTLLSQYPDIHFVYPVHPNPNVRTVAEDFFRDDDRVTLCDPLDYPSLVALMDRCHIVLTDSGGLQEEAPALGKPVLVLRTETERPEAIEYGVAKLVGTNHGAIVDEVRLLMDDESYYRQMSKGASPYGDGQAASRIVKVLSNYFCS